MGGGTVGLGLRGWREVVRPESLGRVSCVRCGRTSPFAVALGRFTYVPTARWLVAAASALHAGLYSRAVGIGLQIVAAGEVLDCRSEIHLSAPQYSSSLERMVHAHAQHVYFAR